MFNEIVEFLSPFFIRASDREAIITSAFPDQTALLNKVNYEGAASTFAPRLVRLLQHHGEIAAGEQALWRLLLTIRDRVGVGNEARIDAFESWANVRHEVTLQPGDQATPSVVTTNSIKIGKNVIGSVILAGNNQTFHAPITITIKDMGEEIRKGRAAPSEKEILSRLIDELKAALQSIPAQHEEAVLLVSRRVEALVHELGEQDLDQTSVMRKANRLKEAVDLLQANLPMLADLGRRINAQVVKMAGHQ